jgi:23S rRNA (cytidine2498-2'-O)-methyltransferase
MTETARFLMTTCQIGFEAALKAEVDKRWPALRFAFSRPGFVTFKLDPEGNYPDDFRLRSIFARSHAFSLGKVTGQDFAAMARDAWSQYGDRPCRRVHVWSRDKLRIGHHGYEARPIPEVFEAQAALAEAAPPNVELIDQSTWRNEMAVLGEPILDCVLVEPDQWWIGYHRARTFASRWPGGLVPLELPAKMVSRAWFKMEEALRWSGLPIGEGTKVAEIGAAPGGASQALLSRGCELIGIDPAEMDPEILQNPNFTHMRGKSNQIQRKIYRKVRWLTADMNVAPSYTLDVIEEIISRKDTRIDGMLLTLKILEPEIAFEVDSYIKRIRGWGYPHVWARQLGFNRNEICVAVSKK